MRYLLYLREFADDFIFAVKLSKFSLELKSNIKFKLYFTIDEETIAASGLLITDYFAKVNGETVAFDDLGDGLYCMELEIVAAKLGEALNIEIKETVGASGIELTISPLYYAKLIVAAEGATPAYKNLAKAIKLYADAAAAYAETLDEDSRPAL